ncbi:MULTISPECIES: hypothetical protein [unclassified Pseudoalteromonas]|uniref:hypothetical protein n=1 Tax=unclassified Pseudoalteromonas TaxID=194690 RepID=UPI0025B348DC|nr:MULTISPECIES: hypothetical protein [unclassified Pseudoalteromonas]MDN3377998.1 hypothetical protein [Pseudoalteromonas sp. APC 3893]MDN3386764.1 hypothetical protein [Pseudoalteromonas sp. APC 4017]
MINNKKLMLASLLILLPLIDSLFVPTAFGLQYHSEKAMYLLSAYLIPVKLILVIAGGILLARFAKAQAESDKSSDWYSKFYTLVLFGLAIIQCALFLIICTMYIIVGSQADDYQQQGNISVYTADVGKLGEATHYFSYQCTDQNGFYTLTPIATLDWLGHFNFNVEEQTLVIKHNDYTAKGEQTKQIDLSHYRCED